MTPFYHAQSTVNKFGGTVDDYLPIHNWFDNTKEYTGAWNHRALKHHASGINECVSIFGDYIINSENKKVPVKYIAEQHVIEDCGFIPTIQDWLAPLLKHPEEWMLKVKTKSITAIKIN